MARSCLLNGNRRRSNNSIFPTLDDGDCFCRAKAKNARHAARLRTTIAMAKNISLSCDSMVPTKRIFVRFLEMVLAGSSKTHQESYRCFACQN